MTDQDTMPAVDLEGLESLAKAASVGERYVQNDDQVFANDEGGLMFDIWGDNRAADAAFIAAANPATVLSLITLAKRALSATPLSQAPAVAGSRADAMAVLRDLYDAMRRYEVDVDGDAPYSHVAMMDRAEAILSQAPAGQGVDTGAVVAAIERGFAAGEADARAFATGQSAGQGVGVEERRAKGIYVASRASVPNRVQMWLRLRASGLPIISTWIDEAGPNQTADNRELWQRIQREVTSAAALVLYVAPNDFPLKGALIEVGMALAAGVPVYVVAESLALDPRTCRPIGSWIRHPGVTFCATVEDAMIAAMQAADAAQPTQDDAKRLRRQTEFLEAIAAPFGDEPTGPHEDPRYWRRTAMALQTLAQAALTPTSKTGDTDHAPEQ